jgi:[acyl-carrier-protein] S-malonyltransferase
MGKDIADAFGAAAEIFQQANDILDFDLHRLCFEGPAQQLSATTVSQPAIFVTSVAILNMLRTSPAADRIRPSITAGLSLGEYTALYAAGLMDFEQALLLVKKRGQAMQDAADAQQGAMVSIIGLDEEKANQLCAEAAQGELLKAVNFNCRGQIVLSGTRTACRRAEQLAPKYEAIKAVPLDVAGAFHTDMMAPAAADLERALADATISDPADIKVIANMNAEYYESADEIRQGLTKQLTCPILWRKCMEKLIADGVEQFYEIGPGRVLTGLMKRINRKAKVVNLSTLDAVNQFIRS